MANSKLSIDLFTKGVTMCCCCELVSVSGQELVGAAPYIREEAAIAPHQPSPEEGLDIAITHIAIT